VREKGRPIFWKSYIGNQIRTFCKMEDETKSDLGKHLQYF